MNEIMTFSNSEFGEIRTVTIDGKEYFYGVDIATSLLYKRPSKAVTDNCKGVLTQDTIKNAGGYPELLITEGDVYRLIIKAGQQGTSKEIREKADKFERWIFDEVLPSIRKTGSYGQPQLPQTTMELLELHYKALKEVGGKVEKVSADLNEVKDDYGQRIEHLENNMTLDYGQQKVLEDTVNKTVIEALGGKSSCAYEEISRKVFAECNRDLKHYFNVNARANVPRRRFDEAVEYARNWKPCTNTVIRIQNYNAQQTLDM